jgi:SAM-dependent methyltransferase
MLKVARRNIASVPLVQGDLLRELPFRYQCFDAILFTLIGEHLKDLRFTLEQFNRVLFPGGRLVFSVWEVDASGLLITDPHAHVPAYDRPSFDGLAQLAFASKADFFTFFGVNPGDKYHDKIQPDEKVFLKGFAFNISKEFLIIPDRETRDPIIFVETHKRKPSFTRAQFQDYWLDVHAHLVVSQPLVRRLVKRYAQLHNISVPTDAFYDPIGDQFDGITVMSFANPTDLENFLTSSTYARIVADENVFVAESDYFTAINYIIINKIPHERRTITH